VFAAQPVSQSLDRSGNIANDFQLREIDLVDLCGLVIYMDNGASVRLHEKGRFLDHVMADIDDQIGTIDGAMNIVIR
jgi:hypothetical protein